MTTTTQDASGRPPADKRQLLAQLLRQRRQQPTFIASYPQQRLWFLDQLQPQNPVYNVPLGYRLAGPLDRAALADSLREIVRRHEVLRTVFREVAGDLRQIVLPELDLELPQVEAPTPQEEEELLRTQARQPFDLSRGPLLRPLLIRTASDRHTLLLTLHHIVFDGWSAGVLVRELAALYAAFSAGRPSPLPELPIQYADFAHWQHQQLRGPHLERLLNYWRQQLAGASSATGLYSDHPRPPVQTYRGDERFLEVPAAVVARLADSASQHGVTLFMFLLAAFDVLLHRHVAEDEVVVGTPIANRGRAELEPLIGFFTNTLVLRTDLGGDPTFPQLLQRVKNIALGAYDHQDLPFERLVDELQLDRNLAQNPLFQVLFSYREGEEEGLELPGLETHLVVGDSGTAKFDLSLNLSRRENGTLHGRFELSADLYEAATIERLAARYATLLRGLAEDPSRRLSQLPLLSAGERHQLLETCNDTAVAYTDERQVQQLIAEQAAKTPDAVALIDGDETLTYRQLHHQAIALGRYLRRQGAAAERPVGLHLARSARLVVAMLAVLEAGAPYLPLDPAYPSERLHLILADADTRWIVTAGAPAAHLSAAAGATIDLDRDRDAITAADDELPAAGSAQQAAYLTYTSGSTGRPKGVIVSHRNVVNFFAGMDRVAGGNEAPGTWLALTSVSFDISVLELLWTLARGFTVVLGDEPGAARHLAPTASRAIDFSLFYFGGNPRDAEHDRYRLLLAGARFADRHGFQAVWTPERHFHEFGGLFPNPSVTGAAVAAVTERVAIRAGSVVLPLHEPLRVAEEWSVVDNLSRGRAGISFASGWHANDFALAPDNYERRKAIMLETIDEVRRLWRGEAVERRGGAGNSVELRIFPPPVQPQLPVWLTSAGNPETFRLAGEIGAAVLTHLLGHDLEQLDEKLQIYRRSWRQHQPQGDGHVTLMLHTFVGDDVQQVRALAHGPLSDYLRTSFGLLATLGRSLGRDVDFDQLPAAELDELVALATERFADTAALLGTPETCLATIERLKAIGVDEIACLIDFGVAVEEVLASLVHLDALRRLELAARRLAQRHESLTRLIHRHGVSHLQCTPSLARLLLADDDSRDSLATVRKMFVGGEALPADLAGQLCERGVGALYNMYGPTETTVWSTTWRVEEKPRTVAIGRPIANTSVYLLDGRQQLAPLGTPAELTIGGDGVTRGYHARSALTATRFVPDPFSHRPGQRLYRTGDLARLRADGELEFLGRLDHQVKVRGYRIELGEIEARLREHPGIGAAVAAVGDGGSNLLAYCVLAPPRGSGADATEEASDVTATVLRQYLQLTVPEYMLPSAFIFLDALPLTPNGKIDRRALASTNGQRSQVAKALEPPESHLEQTLADIWSQVLNVERLGIDDNFFDLGGNSFSIVQVRSRLLAELGRAPTLVDLFRYPTIGTLAAALERQDNTAALTSEQVTAQARKRAQALSRRGDRRRQLKLDTTS